MFYESISDVYDFIFPQNRKQLEFIEGVRKISADEKILDIGCATGNLTELLAEKSDNVTGIDLDITLLQKAAIKNIKGSEFKHLNMLDIDKIFKAESIDRVISFGNTLVHLPDRDSVIEYINKVYMLLKKGGVFITQIINYDRIINKSLTGLNTIDNSEVTFKRDYLYHKSQGYVDFITELYIKRSRKRVMNNIPLLALTRNELNEYLKNSGFYNIKFYGDLQMGEITSESVPLLFSCYKV